MNTVDWVSRTIRFGLSVEDDDGDAARRRARVLQFGQEIFDEVWLYYPWSWKKTSASVSVSAAGVGSLPADFGEIGRDGNVYAGSNLMTAVPDQAIHSYVQWGGGAEEYTYSVRGIDAAGTLQIRVSTSAAQTVTVYYEKRSPELVDIAAPAVEAISGGAVIGNGTFSYKVTFVTAEGESEGGLVSEDVTTAGGTQRVSITDIPIGPAGTTSRKIYRTANGGVTHKLLTTIANNTATTFTDDIADASLGADVPTTNTTLWGLERIPATYHNRVLIPGLRWKVLEDIGDDRAKTTFKAYESGLQWMAVRERPRREAAQRMPRASIGGW